ncbi:hypothetical protein KIN20_037578 [Parelaphostrongylus tenuis]|uniref:Uncharacterized protein n=1 Tax=Parelaphostrongylus tenuis TaxID=148309 RepID=A0AAD5WL96_PARTN|nr:hypothetical protein KIN20_037578 [Parelaphostrongylus tenuis]
MKDLLRYAVGVEDSKFKVHRSNFQTDDLLIFKGRTLGSQSNENAILWSLKSLIRGYPLQCAVQTKRKLDLESTWRPKCQWTSVKQQSILLR